MPELKKSMWQKEFIKDFYPDSTFLSKAEDVSKDVDNDKLNLVESGADPEVMWDNTVFPIPIVEQSDVPYEVLLRRASTKNTVVRDLVQAARNQNLRDNAMKAHKRNLRLDTMQMAAHSYATAATDAGKGNVIVPTSGTARPGSTLKAAKFSDLLTMGEVWDEFDIPAEARNIVMDTKHMGDLRREDLGRYESLIKEINTGGGFSTTFGAHFHKYSQNPYYDITDDSKLAFGQSPTASHTRASFGFIDTEVLWAFGNVKMFARLDDPEAEGDIFHFRTRFIALTKRNKFRVSLLSHTA